MKATWVLIVLFAGVFTFRAGAASDSAQTTVLHSTIPAGYDVLMIKPGGTVLTLLGLIECPELEGVQQVTQGTTTKVLNADGEPLTHFPRDFSFRITASLRKTVLVEPTEVFDIAETPQDLLLGLKFRLRTFHGLQTRQITPESVQMIGVPADVPYDERVYRVSFSVADLPVTDRCVLEVLAPDGERLTRFHFDLL